LNILALDTSTKWGAIAVAGSGGATHGAVPDPEQRHGRNLIPGVRDLLRAAGLAPADLDVIAVGLGPGSYTGLRIGLTAAKTLAYATRSALVGLDSLEVIARNAPAEAHRVAVIADAQRGDLYTAEFTRSEPGGALVRVSPTRIEPFTSWVARLAEGSCVLGPGLELYRSALSGVVRTAGAEADRPDPRRLLDAAREAWESGRRDDPGVLEPLYLRRSAAEEQWDKKA
jgi:tRNA threonylcarbamoyladenosine biosynthesis protein TsaB